MLQSNSARAKGFLRAALLLTALALVLLLWPPGAAEAQDSQTYSVSSSTAAGEGENASLTVTLGQNAPTGGLEFTVTPTYSQGAGRAAAADVANLPTNVTVAAGDISATLSIALVHDQSVEPEETFTVTIATQAAGWSASPAGGNTATVTIQDRTVSPADLQATADDNQLSLTWIAPPGTVTGYDVQFKDRDAPNRAATTRGDPSTGWADANHSGIVPQHTISGLKNDFRYHVRVRAVDAQGSGPWARTGGAPYGPPDPKRFCSPIPVCPGTTPIPVLPPVMNIDSHDDSVFEGQSIEVIVNLGPLPADYVAQYEGEGDSEQAIDESPHLSVDTAVRIQVDTSNPLNTATQHDDYRLTTQKLTFPAYSQSAHFRVYVHSDQKTEGPETIVLKLSPVHGAPYTLGNHDTIKINIGDTSTDPKLWVLGGNQTAEGAGSMTLTFLLPYAAPPEGETLNLTIGSGSTATAGQSGDFTLSTRSVNVPSGRQYAQATLNIIDDDAIEGAETIVLKAASTNPKLPAVDHTITIRDNDPVTPPDQQQPATPNRAPTVFHALEDITIPYLGGTREAFLIGLFEDADKDDLAITAVSSNDAVATAVVSDDYSTMTVTAKSRGTATVTLTADDGNGGTVSDPFTVTVKAAPVVASPIADVSQLVLDATHEVPLLGIFSDPDGDDLYFINAVVSNWGVVSNRPVVTVGKVIDPVTDAVTAITVLATGPGTATITVTAEDANRNRVSDAFDVTVPTARQLANNPPTVASAIPDVTIINPSGSHQASLPGVFTDADQDDSPTITASSSDETVATASVSADYSTLTVSAQARGTATITVTAADGYGGSVEDIFTLTVKAAPVVTSAIADVSGLEVDATHEVSMSGVFSDADGDAITVTGASSSDNSIAVVSTAIDGATSAVTAITVIAKGEGTATITVTAQDSDGNRVSDAFTVTVPAAQQQVVELPGPVTGLTVAASTEDSVNVSWSTPETGGAPDGYIVHLRPEGGKHGSGTTKRPGADRTTVIFDNLESGRSYQIWVRAQNEAGKGERVNASIPLPAVLPGPATGLGLTAMADTVTVSWQAPESGGAPDGYIVHIKPEDGGKGKTKTPRAKKTSVTFKNLESGNTYEVWVRAQNEAGKGERVHATITLPEAGAGQSGK